MKTLVDLLKKYAKKIKNFFSKKGTFLSTLDFFVINSFISNYTRFYKND